MAQIRDLKEKTNNVVRIIKASNQPLVQQQNGSRMNVKAE